MASYEPIVTGSVADMAYHRLRSLIESGALAPNERLQQGALAEAFRVSRTSVREALHRLTADDLVEFQANRGFFVASFRLEDVIARLELRLLMEPGIAGLAAERRSARDVAELREIVATQRSATEAELAHDRSRGFHIRLAASTGNRQFVRILDALWSPEVGRQLIARRSLVPGWQEADADEHQAILDAVAAGDRELAERRMEEHVAATLRHWAKAAITSHREET